MPPSRKDDRVFIIKSKRMDGILCKDGNIWASRWVGPGGKAPKLFKTRKGAERSIVGNANMREVVELDDKGQEICSVRIDK
jgi:hypothetical protein